MEDRALSHACRGRDLLDRHLVRAVPAQQVLGGEQDRAAVRRVRYYSYGGPEVLKVEEAEVPTPGEGQVLIRAEVIGANFVDTKFRQGPSAGTFFNWPLPGAPTGDVVGAVEAVGAGVDPSLVGRKVAALVEEAFADFVLADAAWLADVPASRCGAPDPRRA